jgi:hypothetical protein
MSIDDRTDSGNPRRTFSGEEFVSLVDRIVNTCQDKDPRTGTEFVMEMVRAELGHGDETDPEEHYNHAREGKRVPKRIYEAAQRVELMVGEAPKLGEGRIKPTRSKLPQPREEDQEEEGTKPRRRYRKDAPIPVPVQKSRGIHEFAFMALYARLADELPESKSTKSKIAEALAAKKCSSRNSAEGCLIGGGYCKHGMYGGLVEMVRALDGNNDRIDKETLAMITTPQMYNPAAKYQVGQIIIFDKSVGVVVKDFGKTIEVVMHTNAQLRYVQGIRNMDPSEARKPADSYGHAKRR